MSVKFEVTLKDFRKEGACFAVYNKVVRSLQGKPFSWEDGGRESYIRFAHKDQISLLSILESNGLDDALWALRCVPGVDRDARLFAVWCARQVQHLMGDARSVNALDVAERFADGAATSEELDAAQDAARSAAWSAARSAAWNAAQDAARSAAWNAARSAAWNAAQDAAWNAAQSAAWNAARSAAWNAAQDAAWNAARSAAWNAARSAAWSAAQDAAWNAAWNAARSAAWNAARSAARSAAQDAQKEMFILMCNGKAPWQKGAA